MNSERYQIKKMLKYNINLNFFHFKNMEINPNAFGKDSGVHFILSFFVKILEVTSSKIPPTLFFVWSLFWAIFVNNVNVKRYSKIFENSFLKKGILEFWLKVRSFFLILFQWQYCSLSKNDLYVNRHYEFSRRTTKIVIRVL